MSCGTNLFESTRLYQRPSFNSPWYNRGQNSQDVTVVVYNSIFLLLLLLLLLFLLAGTARRVRTGITAAAAATIATAATAAAAAAAAVTAGRRNLPLPLLLVLLLLLFELWQRLILSHQPRATLWVEQLLGTGGATIVLRLALGTPFLLALPRPQASKTTCLANLVRGVVFGSLAAFPNLTLDTHFDSLLCTVRVHAALGIPFHLAPRRCCVATICHCDEGESH